MSWTMDFLAARLVNDGHRDPPETCPACLARDRRLGLVKSPHVWIPGDDVLMAVCMQCGYRVDAAHRFDSDVPPCGRIIRIEPVGPLVPISDACRIERSPDFEAELTRQIERKWGRETAVYGDDAESVPCPASPTHVIERRASDFDPLAQRPGCVSHPRCQARHPHDGCPLCKGKGRLERLKEEGGR